MKLIFPLFSTFLLLFITACSLVELDEPLDEDPMDGIDIPTTRPTTIEAFNMAFHGGSERSWTAISFQLAGFDGFQGCRLDDTMMINADGTYEYDGGENLCGAEDDTRMKTGTWEVINGGRNVLFDQGTSNEYMAEVNGFENGVIALSGQYVGLEIMGVYRIK